MKVGSIKRTLRTQMQALYYCFKNVQEQPRSLHIFEFLIYLFFTFLNYKLFRRKMFYIWTLPCFEIWIIKLNVPYIIFSLTQYLIVITNIQHDSTSIRLLWLHIPLINFYNRGLPIYVWGVRLRASRRRWIGDAVGKEGLRAAFSHISHSFPSTPPILSGCGFHQPLVKWKRGVRRPSEVVIRYNNTKMARALLWPWEEYIQRVKGRGRREEKKTEKNKKERNI